MKLADLTPTELLAVNQPEQLFPSDPAEMRKKFISLSMVWHPDKPGGRSDVFAKIASLYKSAEQKVKENKWNGACRTDFNLSDGSTLTVNVLKGADFVLGRQYITDHELLHVLEPSNRKYVNHAHKIPFSFASDRMRDECERYLPGGFVATTPLLDGRIFLSQPKTPDLIRLSDVVEFYGGKLEPRSGAWVVSSLMNLCCYLEYAKIVHGDISPDTYFISPAHHSGALLGGWWYYRREGQRVGPLPRRTIDVIPYQVRVTREAVSYIDHESVRLIGRECIDMAAAPAPVRDWLTSIAKGSAQDQYTSWMKAVDEGFGKRRFVKMDVTAAEVYK